MPVIDFLNHHWEGANFNVTGGARVGDLTIATSQPFDGNTECFATYGVMDAADSLIRYNFVDEIVPMIRSICVELEIPDGRKILIKNKSHDGKKRKTKVPKMLSDLALYMPNFALLEEEGKEEVEQDLEASFLMMTLPESSAPMALRRVLRYFLQYMHGTFKKNIDFEVAQWLTEAENKVIRVNREHYQEVLDHTEELIKEKGESDDLSRIKLLAENQLEKLDTYEEFTKQRPIDNYAPIKSDSAA